MKKVMKAENLKCPFFQPGKVPMKMKVMSEATHPTLKVGDNVLIPIPDVD